MWLALIIMLLAAWSGAAFAAAPESFESLPQLVETAIKNNPDLKSAMADLDMTSARIPQASSYDDPMLELKIDEATTKYPIDFAKIEKTKQVVGLSQQIPFFGKLGLKGEVAARDADSSRWMMGETKLEAGPLGQEYVLPDILYRQVNRNCR